MPDNRRSRRESEVDLVSKQVVRAQRTGYDKVHAMEVEEWRRASFGDRLRGFAAVLAFGRSRKMRPQPDSSSLVNDRWIRIRERYDSTSNRSST